MTTPPNPPPAQPPAPPPGRRHPVLRFVGILMVVLILLAAAAIWYTTTPGFQDRVRREVIATLEKATGGRVELAGFRWRLWHLEVEADNLTIHGLEAPGEIPYAHIDRLFVRAKILSLFEAKIGLNYLAAEHPVVHIIVYPDGSTNQPRPKVVAQSSNPATDTFFNLAIDHAELGNGLAILNQRSIPFDAAANDIGLTLNYVPAKDHYLAALHVADLSAERAHSPTVHSDLSLQLDMGRDSFQISSLELHTGQDTLRVRGTVSNYKDPQWVLQANGRIDLRTVRDLTALPGLQAGIVDLNLGGHGSTTRFAANGQVKVAGAAYKIPGADLSGVDATTNVSITDQEIGLTNLNAHLQPGGSATGEVHIVNWLPASAPRAPVKVAPVKHRLSMRDMEPWRKHNAPRAPEPAADLPPAPEKGIILAEVHDIKLETIMRIVAPKRYQDLGFDTAANGKIAVDWTGTAADLTVKAFVKLAPPHPPSPAQVPVSGMVDAEYFNHGGRVDIKQLDAQTPATQVHVQGELGVHPVAQASALTAELTTSNLGEFNRTLIALGLTANGKSGVQAIPVLLHGQAEFHGTVTGTITNPDVKGHLTATNFDTTFFATNAATGKLVFTPRQVQSKSGAASNIVPVPETATNQAVPVPVVPKAAAKAATPSAVAVKDPGAASAKAPAKAAATSPAPAAGPVVPPIAVTAAHPAVSPINPPTDAPGLNNLHWDRLDADAEYSPQAIAVGQATLTRGSTLIHFSGQLHPRAAGTRKEIFDEYSPLSATVSVQKAAIADVMVAAGSTLPVTGTADLQLRVAGSLANLSGGGNLTIRGGAIYDEPYRSLSTDIRFAGREVAATNLVFLQNGGRLTGDGGYELNSKAFHFNAQGSGFELAHLKQLQTMKPAIGGSLTFDAHGSGTVATPIVNANLHLKNLTVAGQPAGAIDANARTDHNVLFLTVNSSLNTATLHAEGQVQLSGEYQTTAHLAIANFDISPFLKAYNFQAVTGHSLLAATGNIQGPLKTPRNMGGDLTLSQFSAALGGVPLQTDGTLHVQLRDGVLHLDPVHITGDDTNLHAQGTVGIFQPDHDMNLQASGAINMKLMQTINPGVTSSGHIDFTVDATGTVQKPDLKGQVKFTNVSAALEDVPNGLSQVNGTLAFDQDRLEVQNLTAMTGGGQLKIAGYLAYQNGVYADLTATGKDVRVRYQGISSVADAHLHLQGLQTNLLLSGNILLTRFSISPNLDLAALTSSSGGVSAPADPSAPSSHVRLDVHITSSPELDFQNSYAKLAGDVDLRVTGTVATPSLLGHISITDGSATFAGTAYQLQRGDIYFTNPLTIDPVIDMDATAHVEEYDITIGLHGTPSKLGFTYRSEPPLPQGDIFALLALGRTQEEQQIYSNQQQAAGVNSTADALLGGALNATVSSRIQKLFGGGNVKIDPTFVGTLGNSTARITVEQQISKNATLTYATNVNSTAQQLIQGQIDVTRNVSLVAVRDESGVFSIVVKVRKRLR